MSQVSIVASKKPPHEYALISQYDPELIRIAKENGGRWDPASRVWRFSEVGARALGPALTDAGFRVVSEVPEAGELDRLRRQVAELQAQLRARPGRAQSARGRAQSDPIDELLRQTGLPGYRALTKLLHPDTGGDHDWMVRLNAAWDRVGRDERKDRRA